MEKLRNEPQKQQKNPAKTLTHVGVIMDGNRRWARAHALQSVIEGHRMGTRRFIDLCAWCSELAIPYVTVYAFSTENWNREPEEVDGIFQLLDYFFTHEITTCVEKGVRLRILGDRNRLPPHSRETVEHAEQLTSACRTVNAHIALNYGGRDEIVRAIKNLYAAHKGDDAWFNALRADTPLHPGAAPDPHGFGQYLDTAGLPDMDLVIRSGAAGRRRTSGFFPWQTVYAELYFTDVLWPDFSKADLVQAVEWFTGQTVRNLGT